MEPIGDRQLNTVQAGLVFGYNKFAHVVSRLPALPSSSFSMKCIVFRRVCLLVLYCVIGFCLGQSLSAGEPDQEHLDFFESKIRPLLIERCYECHSKESGESAGDLLIDSAEAMKRGGANGPLIGSKDPDKTLLVRVIQYKDRHLQMPPSRKLPQEEIDLIRRWLAMGAPDPREESPREENVDIESTWKDRQSPLARDPSTHWAFVKPELASHVPSQAAGDLDLIAAFSSQRGGQSKIEPAPQASRGVLIRRLFFDLTGLPPTTSQIDAFANSDRPDSYHRLVDRLLASPEFGERFGRYWLDVARYADTVGYALGGKERRIKGSERYRDWTIRAFASDMPYDQMIRHQLAGDRTDPQNSQNNLDAMGFLSIGRRFLNQYDTWDDRIDVVTRGLLGMTVACARCHDHKFDPIPTSDYYSLLGVMQSSKEKIDGPSPLMLVDHNPRDTHVLIRGQQGNRGEIAPRRFLSSLRSSDEDKFTDGSGRLELANRIADPGNPLTARVMVNRVWGHLIGKPLVDSPSDFGFRTTPPAIPEILDDLSADFARHWSIKRLVRRIVLTRTYQQSCQVDEHSKAVDPENRLLCRANRRRRDFESMRDSMLFVADSLKQTLGGESVDVTLSSLVPRRTIYSLIDRQNLPSIFRTFDFASPDAHSPGRYFTTVPQQTLYLLNDHQTAELARRVARHVRRVDASQQDLNGSQRLATLVAGVFRQVVQREPNADEQRMMTDFLSRPVGTKAVGVDPRSSWQYGIASIDKSNSLRDFRPFAVFKSDRWQSAADFPSSDEDSYASLTKEGGHPGRDNRHSVVRRWQAPETGRVTLIGQMGHRGEKGDGIRSTILVNNRSIFSETQIRNNRPYGPISAAVKKGQFVDLVASPGESESFDSFFWRTRIKLRTGDGRIIEADSEQDFSGPFNSQSNQPLDRLAQLAQVLMMSNEFAFVD